MRARDAGQRASIVSLLLLSIVTGSALCTTSIAQETSLEGYTGPKKRIAVIDFEVKAPGAGKELGQGMAEMLINALVESNRFIVLERTAVQEILQEQAFDISGAV